MTIRPLTPRVPEPTQPWRPRPLLPRIALFTFLAAVLSAAVAGLLTSPSVIHSEQVASSHYSVSIVNFAFSPAAITVHPGDTITWTNQDSAPHTVTTSSGPQALNSPNLSQGQSWSFTFSAVGTYSYYCAVHPDMRAQVVVKAATVTTTTTKPATRAPQTTAAQTKTSHPAGAAHPQTTTAAPTTSTPAGSSASAAGAAAEPSPTSSATEVAASPAGATTGLQPLSPALLLGGMTAAVAVFCLLLLASRSALDRGRDRAQAEPDES